MVKPDQADAPAEAPEAPRKAPEAPKQARAPRKSASRAPARKPAATHKSKASAQTAHVERQAAADHESQGFADRAAHHTVAFNPLMGVRFEDLTGAARNILGAAVKEPKNAVRHVKSLLGEAVKIVKGQSEIEIDPKDRRFADTAWKTSGIHRGLLQAHAALAREINGFIDDSELSRLDKERARVIATIVTDSLSPSNSLLNPAALKHAIDTGGKSFLTGARHLVSDIRYNNWLPSSVDKSPFKVGENICTSPGKVVFRNEVLELIQYECTSDKVRRTPLVVCPPQVNKFYALDLAPDKSFVKFAAANGQQLFAVSWRNPTVEHRDWDMGAYVKALDHAVDAALEITGSKTANMWGACSGGMTMTSYLAWLAATGDRKIRHIVTPVCVLDASKAVETTMGLFATPASLAAVRASVARKGIVDGADMARVFAWLRPNDLIWNYWVNNYLMGNKPPAFDILYWNADTTRLPAAFHADLLTILEKAPFSKPGVMKVLGKPIDMRKVNVEAFVVAGITDHITPWRACYATARIFGPGSEFILANAGHLQSILNPPGAPKAFHYAGKAKSADADDWAATAERREGSWWPHLIEWLSTRSGEEIDRPAELGSRKHPPSVAAPGEYAFED